VTTKEQYTIINSLFKEEDFNVYWNKYNDGVDCLNLKLDATETDIVNYIDKHPKWFTVINAGVAIFKRDSNLHKRFVLLASLIESNPNGFDKTLNRQRISFALLKLGWLGIKTVSNMSCAYILFKIKGWK
jgi:hypothetical protein